jgi:streptomycin 6-kinase
MGPPGGISMPVNLVAAAAYEGREAWLYKLPSVIRRLQREWTVTIGEPFQPGGQTAWVAPAERTGEQLVIKVRWRHTEAEHEANGLRVWDGDGTVRLCDACDLDAETTVLLMERCQPGAALLSVPEPEQDMVIARLLSRLWRDPPSGHQFRPLKTMCDAWADEFDAARATTGSDLDPGLVREAMTLFRELPGGAQREVLLCTDLHAGNVLAAEREPWLVIDPKPYVGDASYDALQHMLNCERLYSDPRSLVARMAGLLELDRDRLQLWLFARCVQESPHCPGLGEVARRLAER